MDYDKWKTEVPENDLEKECNYCGEPCKKEFCNKQCRIAYEND